LPGHDEILTRSAGRNINSADAMCDRRPAVLVFIAATLLVAGCAGTPLPAETAARNQAQQLGRKLRLPTERPSLAELRTDSPPEAFVLYAVLNHPAVIAAYDDWRARIEDIVPARSPQDPQFVFQADIADTLMSFMPGLMFNFMGSGKRLAMSREATAAAEVARRDYISAVLTTAAEARKAWIELAYLDEAVRLKQLSVGALESSLATAGTEFTTGRGMSTLADQVRIANDLARTRSELGTLADRRTAVGARFKTALGLGPSDPDPVWPAAALTATAVPGPDELWRRASEANPELGRMRSMVDMAVAGVAVAHRAGQPDFTLGAMVELKADPRFVRPLATLALPIWREKIAAIVSAADARRDASVARLSTEQLNLAAELAQMLFMVREADRMIAYVDQDALPNFDRTIATAEAAYQSGTASPGMISETQVMALTMRLERLGALRDREIAVTELMLLTADVAPAGSPVPETSPQS
jgi:outer membrane protein, heavy metal efflux system